MRLPNHYAKPSGVPAFRPEEEKFICPICEKMLPVSRGHMDGCNLSKNAPLFCSESCLNAANEKRRKQQFAPV